MIATKKEMRSYMREIRETWREIDRLLTLRRFEDAAQLATDLAGYAGEIENLVHTYADERTDSQFISGDQYSMVGRP